MAEGRRGEKILRGIFRWKEGGERVGAWFRKGSICEGSEWTFVAPFLNDRGRCMTSYVSTDALFRLLRACQQPNLPPSPYVALCSTSPIQPPHPALRLRSQHHSQN